MAFTAVQIAEIESVIYQLSVLKSKQVAIGDKSITYRTEDLPRLRALVQQAKMENGSIVTRAYARDKGRATV